MGDDSALWPVLICAWLAPALASSNSGALAGPRFSDSVVAASPTIDSEAAAIVSRATLKLVKPRLLLSAALATTLSFSSGAVLAGSAFLSLF